jgi:cytochrome c
MRCMDFALIAMVVTGCILSAGCTQSLQPAGSTSTPTTTPDVPSQLAQAGNLTTNDLIAFVSEARAYARANGKEKAIALFNDPNGQFCRNGLYIFAEGYDWTALAEPYEH